MGTGPNDGFDPRIAELIRHKVHRLIGRYGFTESDRDDLRQEVSMHVLVGMRRYDPTRAGTCTYADRIVTSKVASIVGHAMAQKRDRRRLEPIDRVAEPLACGRVRSREQQDAVLDVREAVGQLPDDLRPLASLFMEHREAEVIRRTGLSRQVVRGRRTRIAQHLRALS